jgi:FixJ family two-component response regulator
MPAHDVERLERDPLEIVSQRFVTALLDEKFRVRAMSAGAVGFLSKPFDESLLISCLDSALNPSIVPPSMGRSTMFA